MKVEKTTYILDINSIVDPEISVLASLLAPVAFIIFVIAKKGETVCSIIYKRHVRDIMEKILARENQFVVLCQRYYKEIDDLYLHSLALVEQGILNNLNEWRDERHGFK